MNTGYVLFGVCTNFTASQKLHTDTGMKPIISIATLISVKQRRTHLYQQDCWFYRLILDQMSVLFYESLNIYHNSRKCDNSWKLTTYTPMKCHEVWASQNGRSLFVEHFKGEEWISVDVSPLCTSKQTPHSQKKKEKENLLVTVRGGRVRCKLQHDNNSQYFLLCAENDSYPQPRKHC